jgi:hypothetical protein
MAKLNVDRIMMSVTLHDKERVDLKIERRHKSVFNYARCWPAHFR